VRGALVLGRLAVMKNDLASAQRWADEATALSAGDKTVQSGLHMLRGDVLARQGRASEAEREFLEEIRLYPGPPGRPRLALGSLRLRRKREDARRTLIGLVTRQPSPESFLLAMKTFRATEDPAGEREMRLEAKRRFPRDPRF
jgi:Flp pilus assembly protein TadD